MFIIIFTEGLILRDCVEYRQLGVHTSGVYPVSPNGENIFQVCCLVNTYRLSTINSVIYVTHPGRLYLIYKHEARGQSDYKSQYITCICGC